MLVSSPGASLTVRSSNLSVFRRHICQLTSKKLSRIIAAPSLPSVYQQPGGEELVHLSERGKGNFPWRAGGGMAVSVGGLKGFS